MKKAALLLFLVTLTAACTAQVKVPVQDASSDSTSLYIRLGILFIASIGAFIFVAARRRKVPAGTRSSSTPAQISVKRSTSETTPPDVANIRRTLAKSRVTSQNGAAARIAKKYQISEGEVLLAEKIRELSEK